MFYSFGAYFCRVSYSIAANTIQAPSVMCGSGVFSNLGMSLKLWVDWPI
jgi:hypothetical protein